MSKIERTETTKKCVRCKEFKLYSDFALQQQKTKDGHRNICKIYDRIYHKNLWVNTSDDKKKQEAERKAKWYQENKVRIRQEAKEHIQQITENNVSILKERQVKKFGIDIKRYLSMRDQQNNLCAICGKPEIGTRNGKVKMLAVDHDHENGMVRMLLCATCNNGLGCFKDNVDLIIKAAEYIAHFNILKKELKQMYNEY